MLGEDAREALEEMQDIARMLEEEGYVRREGDRWELTPRAIRKMGERALREVFGNMQKDRLGGHRIESTGFGGEENRMKLVSIVAVLALIEYLVFVVQTGQARGRYEAETP